MAKSYIDKRGIARRSGGVPFVDQSPDHADGMKGRKNQAEEIRIHDELAEEFAPKRRITPLKFDRPKNPEPSKKGGGS